MKRLFIIILLFSALLSGCEKSTDPQQKFSNSGVYPTTYMKLDSTLTIQRRSDYLLKNKYLYSSLNTFGFCDWNGDPLLRGTPPYKGDVSESEAITIIKEFVSNNSSETGISNLDYLDFSKPDKETGYAGSILWYFHSQNQKVDNIEILNSSILFVLTNKCITTCLHNWYPDVYIPNNFNYDQTKAKTILIGQQITYGSWSGAGTSKTITENDLSGCSFDLKIMPIDFSDKIELHVCWKINAPDLFYIFYVDVMTGEILSKESMIFY
jgi:hypothetical protein